jgi:hypothetical protein
MTNAAAIGYMIRAMIKLGFSKEEIKTVECAMRTEMDFATEEQAESTYNRF